MQTNRHNEGHLDRIDGGPSPLPDAIEAEMVFVSCKNIANVALHRDKLTD